jgi:hypothetical protein
MAELQIELQVLQNELRLKLSQTFKKSDSQGVGAVPVDEFLKVLDTMNMDLLPKDRHKIKTELNCDGLVPYGALIRLLKLDPRG